MKHYDSFENIKYDGTLLGEEIWAFNKLDGQNFCAKYSPKQKEFSMFGSKTQNVDETSEQFGKAVEYFKANMANIIRDIIIENSKKRGIFNGINEITIFCEWYGENTFSGFHVEGEELKLCLIDVFLKKKGYIEPKFFYELFNGKIEIPEVVYRGKLTNDFIQSIQNNDWTDSNCQYPKIKEGVVCKRSTLMKGQRLPKSKIKTKWWLDKLTKLYPDRWKELE
jgi:hypothetical protein